MFHNFRHRDHELVFHLSSAFYDGQRLLMLINRDTSSPLDAIQEIRDNVVFTNSPFSALKLLTILMLVERLPTGAKRQHEIDLIKVLMAGPFTGNRGKHHTLIVNKTMLVVAALTRSKTSYGTSLYTIFTRTPFFHLGTVVDWSIDSLMTHLEDLLMRLFLLCVERRSITRYGEYDLNSEETLAVMKSMNP